MRFRAAGVASLRFRQLGPEALATPAAFFGSSFLNQIGRLNSAGFSNYSLQLAGIATLISGIQNFALEDLQREKLPWTQAFQHHVPVSPLVSSDPDYGFSSCIKKPHEPTQEAQHS